MVQKINIGNIVNDGLGDDLRTAFQKVNANFTELDAGLTITASNLGLIGETVFVRKYNNNLEFKRLIAGNKITLDSSPDVITINATQPDAFTKITTNIGEVLATNRTNITIQGGASTTVVADSDLGVITIDTKQNLDNIFQTLDFGPINGVGFQTIVQATMAATNFDLGTITNPGRIGYDLGGFGV